MRKSRERTDCGPPAVIRAANMHGVFLWKANSR
jgi:hypothetical protein